MSADARRLATVVSVRGRDRDALLADPAFVYVGRGVTRGKKPWQPSVWANPFRIGMKGAAARRVLGHGYEAENAAPLPEYRSGTVRDARDACRLYRTWLELQPELLARIRELEGKTLGCWCGDWAPGGRPLACHARVLAGMVNVLAPRNFVP